MEGYTYKVSATTASGIPESMSNFIYTTKYNNGIYDIYDIIEESKGNADIAARRLNAHKDILRTFKPFRTFNGGFILIAEDRIGNKSFITAKKDNTINSEDIRRIYDNLRNSLEEYETDDGSGDAGDAGERLHGNIVWVVNALAKVLK